MNRAAIGILLQNSPISSRYRITDRERRVSVAIRKSSIGNGNRISDEKQRGVSMPENAVFLVSLDWMPCLLRR